MRPLGKSRAPGDGPFFMKCGRSANTPAHKTEALAELVCSNSLKTEQENSAPWLLKEELRRLNSPLIAVAARTRVPAGHALTVDRELFASEVTRLIEADPGIELRREEVTELGAERDKGRPVDRRDRPADLRCARRRDRPHHGIGTAVLLRQHQSHRRG